MTCSRWEVYYIAVILLISYTYFFPITYYLLPITCSQFPIPDFRFPTPDSRFPIPDSLLPIPYSHHLNMIEITHH
ncbi:hypothetical protein [Moorena producens]|uniref:hypothetical protein n=1 Tax=Moorena producens TaxID=1155739 RepID=UPI0013143D05|nr:hypothetical protein [Moorena producens]